MQFEVPAPATPTELLKILAVWHAEHEMRPASIQQTAMTMLYSAMRVLVDEHQGNIWLRLALQQGFPELQQGIWDANRAGSDELCRRAAAAVRA